VGKPIAWTSDSKQIISFKTGYDWKSSLMVVNSYGGPSVELGKERTLVAWGQMWTPDGEKIITESDTDYWWIIPTKGGPSVKFELRPEPKSTGFVIPSFSPDLTKSAYISGDGSLWVLPISIDEAKATEKPVKVAEKVEMTKPYVVSWSPDSKWIAFSSGAVGSRNIWIVSVKGGEARQLTKQPGDEPEFRGNISWSPDSKWVTYSDKEGIWVVSSSGGEPRQLVKSEKVSEPVWFPDGNEIAFMEKSYISIVNVQTGEIKHVLDLKVHNIDGEESWNLAWSPDGQKLGFIGFKDRKYRALVISVPEGNLMELAEDDPGDKSSLVWSPDGKKVSYSSDRYFKVRTGAIWAMDVEELVSKTE
jgi:Tol biopolymer transport system component